MVKVSVIFRVKDDERIYIAINSLKGQDCEIIVVQNGSKSLWGDLGVKLIYSEIGNASHAYNIGVKEAIGDIVVCCDSDVILSKTFIEDVKKYAEHGVIKSGGMITQKMGESNVIWNQACFMYRDDYLACEGHDEEFDKPNATDIAFSFKAKKHGLKLEFIPKAVYYHPETYQKRGYHVGKAEARVCKKYPKNIKVYKLIIGDIIEICRNIRNIIGLIVGSL